MTMRALVSADRPVVRIWEACLAAAKDEGIAREDIEEETGDLIAYMGAVIANLVNQPRRRRMTIARLSAWLGWCLAGPPDRRVPLRLQPARSPSANAHPRAPQDNLHPSKCKRPSS